MVTQDAQDAAAGRAAAAAFVEDLPDGFQVGLVAYDQTARVLAPPTTDHAAVVAALNRLAPGAGTATGAALDAIAISTAALDVKTTAATSGDADATTEDGEDTLIATIVLLSGGATTVGTPLDVATQAGVEQGVPVMTIAYGTDEGTVTVQGPTVTVPADEAAMQEVADATGGTAFTAASADKLDQVYDDIQSRIGTVLQDREILRTFVGVAVVALLAVAGSLLWSGRFL